MVANTQYTHTHTHLAVLALAATVVARKWQTFIHSLPSLPKRRKRKSVCVRERERKGERRKRE